MRAYLIKQSPFFFLKIFNIEARESDRLIFEVKDKFAKTKPSINRFLGRISLDFMSLVNKAALNNG